MPQYQSFAESNASIVTPSNNAQCAKRAKYSNASVENTDSIDINELSLLIDEISSISQPNILSIELKQIIDAINSSLGDSIIDPLFCDMSKKQEFKKFLQITLKWNLASNETGKLQRRSSTMAWVCNQQFTSLQAYGKHIHQTCKKCGKEYTSIQGWLEHIELHSQIYVWKHNGYPLTQTYVEKTKLFIERCKYLRDNIVCIIYSSVEKRCLLYPTIQTSPDKYFKCIGCQKI